MEYARIKVSGSSAELTVCKPIVAGTIGGTVSFQFDESWDGLIKTLVWRGNGITVDDATFSCIIPAEVVAFPGRLYVGVYGVKDNTATPTVWVDLGQIQPGADPSGDPATDPTLPVWAQIMQKMHIDDQSIGANAWSSKNTVDKLCPSFTESGPAVTCEPVEGYPLTVQADRAAKVYRIGKNLIKVQPRQETEYGVTCTVLEDGTVVLDGTATKDFSFTVSQRIPIKAGATYTLSGCTGGTYRTYQLYIETSGIINMYNANTNSTQTASGSGFVEAKIGVYTGASYAGLVIKPQLEIGSSATAFELGRETEEFTPGEAIPALSGVNTIWAASGEIAVSGKADPVAVIEKLTNAILSLGGNV